MHDAPGIRTSDPQNSDLQSHTLRTALLRIANQRPERRGADLRCRKIFTLYAVEDRLGFVKNGRGIVQRKFIDLSSETENLELLQLMAEISLVEDRPLTCKPYGLVGNVRRGAAVLPTNFGGARIYIYPLYRRRRCAHRGTGWCGPRRS